MGDFNAKVRNGKLGKVVGPFELGEHGERLSIFAMDEQFIINIFFKLLLR